MSGGDGLFEVDPTAVVPRSVSKAPLYAGWIAGAVLVMMFTGLLMWVAGLLPFISRTSAIFVHDILAWGIALVLIGHMRKAYQDPEARRRMRTGSVDRKWADLHHSMWLSESGNERNP